MVRNVAEARDYHEFTHVVQFMCFMVDFEVVRLLKIAVLCSLEHGGNGEIRRGPISTKAPPRWDRDAVYTNTLIGLPELQGFNLLNPIKWTLGYKTEKLLIRYLADDLRPEKWGQFLKTMESYFDVSSALNSCWERIKSIRFAFSRMACKEKYC